MDRSSDIILKKMSSGGGKVELRSGQGVLLQTALRLDDGPALGVETWRSQMLILHRAFECCRCQKLILH